MNIGLIIISEPHGGSETVVYNLQKYFSNGGHKVTIIANDEFFYWDPPIICEKINLGPLLDFGFLIKRIFGLNQLPESISKKKYFILPTLLNLYFKIHAKHIFQKIITKRIETLHYHDPFGLKLYKHLTKICSIPSIYTFHGPNIDLPFYIRGLKYNFVKLINSMDAITTVSNYMLKHLILQGVEKDTKVIYNGIDPGYFHSIKRKLYEKKNEDNDIKNEDKFALLFPGGGKIWKGGKELLEAMSLIKNQIPSLKLYVTREVPENHIYRDMTRKYGLEKNVCFMGLLSKEKYYEYLDLVDCLVMPSDNEPFGMVFLDAMAMGKPIVASNNGGAIEVIENKVNGLLCERNPKDIAKKIVYLFNNPKLRQSISKNNLAKVKQFDWNDIACKYIDLYESIVK